MLERFKIGQKVKLVICGKVIYTGTIVKIDHFNGVYIKTQNGTYINIASKNINKLQSDNIMETE